MPSYNLKNIDEKLLPQIAAIYNHYVRNSTATFHTREVDIDTMRDILFDGDSRFPAFAIFDADELCGYCILARYKKREAYDGTAELTIYLKPGCESRGIGSYAASRLEKIAAENKFHSLLAVICRENTASVRLFSKLGYEKCAHLKEVGSKFGRLLDIVYYQKILEQ